MKFPRWLVNLGLFGSALLVSPSPAARAADVEVIAPAPLTVVPKDKPHVLRVLHLVDPRLPMLTEVQRRALHKRIEDLLQSWFGYTVTLREVGVRDLAQTFAAQEAVFARHKAVLEIDIDPYSEFGRGDFRGTVWRAIAQHDLPLIARHLDTGPLTSKEKALELACARFLSRLKELQDIPVAGGETFSSPSRRRLHSYGHWCAFTHEMADADFVFTNSMMLGADQEMSIYVIGRGGVSLGNVNANRHNAYRASGVVSLFPFLSDAPFWRRERGPLPEAERLDVIATLAMHELGHFFLRRAEYYDHAHCVHVAPGGFRLYEWHRAIREQGPCTLEHRTLTSY